MQPYLNRLIFIFSLIGLGVSIFLSYEYLQPNPITCPLTGNGCELVRKSEYSHIFGISIPYLGIFYYFLTAVLSIYLTQNYKSIINRFRFLISFFALIFGIYLTYLEGFIIKAFCFWCLFSFAVTIIIVVLNFKSILVKQNEN